MKLRNTGNLEERFRLLAWMLMVIFGILLLRLWFLQIMQGADSLRKAREMQTRSSRIYAPRGIFYDRNGDILVNTRLSSNITVVPEDLRDRPEVLQRLSAILGVPTTAIEAEMQSNPKRQPYQYISVARNVNPGVVLKIYERQMELPGVKVDEVPVRFYRYGEYASHLFGYIREVNDTELGQFKTQNYRMGDLIGKTGLERTYEDFLRGRDGERLFEVDISRRPVRLLSAREMVPGANLHLTIDYKIQQVAERALDAQLRYLQNNSQYRNARSGALVALDPRTGDILAMVSKPGFDPNRFIGVLSPEDAQRIYQNKLVPLLNRVTQGEFAPGSTFKPITVAAALNEHKADIKEYFYCGGYDPHFPKYFKCWIAPGSHGTQNIVAGIKNSCNIVMAELARRVGPYDLAKYCRLFGLGRPTGIELYPKESSGLVPDPDWKEWNTRDKKWYTLETMHMAIGQGYLTMTPLQLAQVYAALANRGKVYRPRLVTRISSADQRTLEEFKPELMLNLRFPDEVWDPMREGLKDVVEGGTAAKVFAGFPLKQYPVAGKTGTVQRPPYDNSGVFVCYAPANNPEIVVVVLIEQGGGGTLAAPAARKVLEAYFKLDEQPRPAITPAPSAAQTPVPEETQPAPSR